MKRIKRIAASVCSLICAFGGLGCAKPQTWSLTAGYDYGMHQMGKAALLLDGSKLFFECADWGITALLAGDVVTVHYKGEWYIQETYPSTVATKDMQIEDIRVEYAPVWELEVRAGEGGVTLHAKNGEAVAAPKTPYLIAQDASFVEITAKNVGQTVYGTVVGEPKRVAAVYAYKPR